MIVLIRPCTCHNVFMDRTYGRGLRPFNPRRAGGHRCANCNAERTFQDTKNQKKR